MTLHDFSRLDTYFPGNACLGYILATLKIVALSPGWTWARDRERVRAPVIRLFRFVCQEGVAEDLEQPSLALPAGATERVNRRTDLNIDETAFLKHLPPACARQATGNSVGPKVDVAERSCWNLLAVRDVGKLQTPARPQHPHDLGKDLALVGAQIDDAVARYDVGPPIFDR
jgi:hypothetical protein